MLVKQEYYILRVFRQVFSLFSGTLVLHIFIRTSQILMRLDVLILCFQPQNVVFSYILIFPYHIFIFSYYSYILIFLKMLLASALPQSRCSYKVCSYI